MEQAAHNRTTNSWKDPIVEEKEQIMIKTILILDNQKELHQYVSQKLYTCKGKILTSNNLPNSFALLDSGTPPPIEYKRPH